MNRRSDFPIRLTQIGLTGEGVEVGVLFGDYATQILKNWPGKLHLVDPWVNQSPAIYLDGSNAVNMDRALEKTRAAVAPYGERAQILKDFSVDAAPLFTDGQLDFVYLDGNHALRSVVDDLVAWWPKIKAGGIISGHDYYDRETDYQSCAVKSAVDAFAKDLGLPVITTPEETPSWFIEKPGAVREPLIEPKAPLMVILPVSHLDVVQAEQWLGWVSQLERANLAAIMSRLIVTTTRGVTQAQKDLLLRACGGIPPAAWYMLHDELEVGYPRAASHLFLRSMEWAYEQFRYSPILWCEADTVPMRAGWFQAIEAEYASCGKPFMGMIERQYGPPHMVGCGVYPYSWRRFAPKLGGVLEAPDIPMFGLGKGQAFDTYAADQIVPLCAESRLIQQIWRPQLPIREAWAKTYIRPETALFHQCKDGSLIAVLRGFSNGYAPPGATSPQQLQPLRGVIFTSKKVGGYGS